jgi:hypothetical protein
VCSFSDTGQSQLPSSLQHVLVCLYKPHRISDDQASYFVTIISHSEADVSAVVVVLLMFGAVIVMVNRVDNDRESHAILDSNDTSPTRT